VSIFSNRAAEAEEGAGEYIEAVLSLVGSRPPLEILAETPPAFHELVRSHGTERLTAPEAPGKWSAAMVLYHMADSELVWGYRLRMVLAHERPELGGYDQDAWAERLGYDGADYQAALTRFEVLRRSHLALLAGLSDDQWDRVAWHRERGEESVRHMTRLYAGHDLVHRHQLVRIMTRGSGGQT